MSEQAAPDYDNEVRAMALEACKADKNLTLLEAYGVMLDTFARMRQDPAKYLNDPDDLESMIFTVRDAALAERQRREPRP